MFHMFFCQSVQVGSEALPEHGKGIGGHPAESLALAASMGISMMYCYSRSFKKERKWLPGAKHTKLLAIGAVSTNVMKQKSNPATTGAIRSH
jgi:hypothetical protein